MPTESSKQASENVLPTYEELNQYAAAASGTDLNDSRVHDENGGFNDALYQRVMSATGHGLECLK